MKMSNIIVEVLRVIIGSGKQRLNINVKKCVRLSFLESIKIVLDVVEVPINSKVVINSLQHAYYWKNTIQAVQRNVSIKRPPRISAQRVIHIFFYKQLHFASRVRSCLTITTIFTVRVAQQLLRKFSMNILQQPLYHMK